jgi:hypothetical protein
MTEENPDGSYDLTFSGTIANERSDSLSQIAVHFTYLYEDNDIGAGTGLAQIDPLAPGADSTWSVSYDDLASPAHNLAVAQIGYIDESTGTSCYPSYPGGLIDLTNGL